MSAQINEENGAVEVPEPEEIEALVGSRSKANAEWEEVLGEEELKAVQLIKTGNEVFPFKLENLAYWVIKRKGGATIKYVLAKRDPKTTSLVPTSYTSSTRRTESHVSYSALCHHAGDQVVFEKDGVRLFIADANGARKAAESFDLIIDCGHVFRLSQMRDPVLGFDGELARVLAQYSTRPPIPRILTIDWDDREAPDLKPEFWPALAGMISGDVLTNCQGGHGRSGTALVCLMMALNPEYSARDAILHLRALHCPRAIESVRQHRYIDEVAKVLGREANSAEVGGINDYKAEFKALLLKSAKEYQARL